MPFEDDERNYPSRPKTCEPLRLDFESAEKGKTWMLLPEGYRDNLAAARYPLPLNFEDLNRIAIIPIRPNSKDAGSIYIRRAVKEYRDRLRKRQTAMLDIGQDKITRARRMSAHASAISKSIAEMRRAVSDVKREAAQSIASLNDLIVLGRRGIEGQMRAHLENKQWNGETIDAAAFRNAFRLVTQAVKSLGVSTALEAAEAKEAVMAQAAAALKDSQDTLDAGSAMTIPPPPDETTEH